MKIGNPKVTLDDEARAGVKEGVRQGFLDWLFRFQVAGDDGGFYSLGGSILSLTKEKTDVVTFSWTKGEGVVRQLPYSIYKVAEFPKPGLETILRKPAGTLQIERGENSVRVTCGAEFQVTCYADNAWRFQIDTLDGRYKADLCHKPYGYPLWYGRETPSYLTQHSVTYGYNWAGDVQGTIWMNGKEIHVRGTGQRERYVAVDSSAAELGGWEDWGYIAFEDLHTSFYEMRLGMKDFSVYDLKTKRYYPEGTLAITHEDWAFYRDLDGFIPLTYKIKMEVSDGTLRIIAKVRNATTWGVTYRVPDNPVATLLFGEVSGTFTLKSGQTRVLESGSGALSVRQWHEYPRVLPRELYLDETPYGEKFETL